MGGYDGSIALRSKQLQPLGQTSGERTQSICVQKPSALPGWIAQTGAGQPQSEWLTPSWQGVPNSMTGGAEGSHPATSDVSPPAPEVPAGSSGVCGCTCAQREPSSSWPGSHFAWFAQAQKPRELAPMTQPSDLDQNHVFDACFDLLPMIKPPQRF
jgi:hypothetical protein